MASAAEEWPPGLSKPLSLVARRPLPKGRRSDEVIASREAGLAAREPSGRKAAKCSWQDAAVLEQL